MSKRKKRKTKKGKIVTRRDIILLIIGAVIGTVIGLITHQSLKLIYSHLSFSLWPPRIDGYMTHCVIYRDDWNDYPICDFGLLLDNSSRHNLSLQITDLILFSDSIHYRFPLGSQVINVSGNRILSKGIELRDRAFESAIRILQDSATAYFAIRFEYLQFDKTDSVVMVDSDVVKCTYWQMPVFRTADDARHAGGTQIKIKNDAWFTDPKTKEPYCVEMPIEFYSNDQTLTSIDLDKYADHILSDRPSILFYRSHLRWKYGGHYIGILEKDTNIIKPIPVPKELFGNGTSKTEKELLGITTGLDYSRIKEFIHYTFDPTFQDDSFATYEGNFDIFVQVFWEEGGNVELLDSLLEERGYRASSMHLTFHDFLTNVLPKSAGDKGDSRLLDELNNRINELNNVLMNDGILIVSLTGIDNEILSRIQNDVTSLLGNTCSMIVNVDCRPLNPDIKYPIFSKPVFVFTSFSEYYKRILIHGIKERPGQGQ